MLALHKCQPWEGSWEQDDNDDSIFWVKYWIKEVWEG